MRVLCSDGDGGWGKKKDQVKVSIASVLGCINISEIILYAFVCHIFGTSYVSSTAHYAF